MRLQQLEARLRELLEVRLVRALPGRRPEVLLVRYITQAIENGARLAPDGRRISPNVFTLQISPGSAGKWREPGLTPVLVQAIQTAASDADLSFDSPPTLSITEDASIAMDEFRVIALHSVDAVGQTQDMQADTDSPPEAEQQAAIPESAFLIVDGVKEYPLTRAVINIGRRLDNDLVVDDPRVSRHHAQLRAIKNRYVLFDLNSSGGTFINGQRTSQTVLYPGDVISLAGVSLIFGQDVPLPQRDGSQTGPRSQMGADRATAIIRSRSGALGKKQ
jgi:pSer/pThr/pTyr-binding forkhead associated (FHA) protein